MRKIIRSIRKLLGIKKHKRTIPSIAELQYRAFTGIEAKDYKFENINETRLWEVMGNHYTLMVAYYTDKIKAVENEVCLNVMERKRYILIKYKGNPKTL